MLNNFLQTRIPLQTGEFKRLSGKDVWKLKMLYSRESKKALPVDRSQCEQLFRPGRNFSKYVQKSEEELTPRAKPNKYLGIPDPVPKKTADYPDAAANTAADTNFVPYDGDDVKLPPTTMSKKKTNIQVLKQRQHTTSTQDPIFDGSDYDTKEKEDRMSQKLRTSRRQ